MTDFMSLLPHFDNPLSEPLIFDSHAHYDDDRFDGVRDGLLPALKSNGVCGVINCGCDLKSSRQSIAFAEKYDFIYAAVGIHPENAGEAPDEELSALMPLYSHKKVVAVGEIGLEYHYDFVPKDRQKHIFESQLKAAKELDLPVIVHDREAHADTLELLKKYRPKGVVHCFSGSSELAGEVIRLGMYIGLGGAATFKNARKPLQVAEMVPDDRLLLETDAPYMSPEPCRGRVCTSSHILFTAEKIAAVRNVSRETLIKKCAENTKELFGIK